jgi:hypothetical protein
VAYVRTVKTSSGATAVQIVWSTRQGSRKIDHLGSAHDEAGVAALKAAAAQRLTAGQVQLEPWPSTSSEKARGIPDQLIHYQYRHDRARRTLRGIDEHRQRFNLATNAPNSCKRPC